MSLFLWNANNCNKIYQGKISYGRVSAGIMRLKTKNGWGIVLNNQVHYSFQRKYALKKRLKPDDVVPIYKSGQVGSNKSGE